jgi:hypothetical protein
MRGGDYSVGDVVLHARFGHGWVVYAEDGAVKVKFTPEETKTFVAEIAPLEKIAEADDSSPEDLDELVEMLRSGVGDDETTGRNPSSGDLFMPSQKVATAIGMWNGQEVIEAVRASEHATEADIIAFCETFIDGPFREAEEGKSFRRLFDRMLVEGGGIIPEQVEKVRLRDEERTKRQREERKKRPKIEGIEGFEHIFEAFFSGNIPGSTPGNVFGDLCDGDFFDDEDDDHQTTATVKTTQPRPVRGG